MIFIYIVTMLQIYIEINIVLNKYIYILIYNEIKSGLNINTTIYRYIKIYFNIYTLILLLVTNDTFLQ